MNTLKIIMLGLLLTALATTGNTAFGATTSELLQQGLYAEEVEGNLDSAIKAYDQIIKNGSAPPNHVAQALYREGMCYLKLKNEAAARTALSLMREAFRDGALKLHPREVPWLDRMQKTLDGMTSSEPQFIAEMMGRVDTTKFVARDYELD